MSFTDQKEPCNAPLRHGSSDKGMAFVGDLGFKFQSGGMNLLIVLTNQRKKNNTMQFDPLIVE